MFHPIYWIVAFIVIAAAAIWRYMRWQNPTNRKAREEKSRRNALAEKIRALHYQCVRHPLGNVANEFGCVPEYSAVYELGCAFVDDGLELSEEERVKLIEKMERVHAEFDRCYALRTQKLKATLAE